MSGLATRYSHTEGSLKRFLTTFHWVRDQGCCEAYILGTALGVRLPGEEGLAPTGFVAFRSDVCQTSLAKSLALSFEHNILRKVRDCSPIFLRQPGSPFAPLTPHCPTHFLEPLGRTLSSIVHLDVRRA